MRIVKVTDGYHESKYYLENVGVITGEDNLIEYLSEPHLEKFHFLGTLYIDDYAPMTEESERFYEDLFDGKVNVKTDFEEIVRLCEEING